jgi:hypothetical protein
MSLKLNSSGGGSVTLQEPSTASNLTVTLPDNSGTLVSTASTFAGTGPAFSAYQNAGLSSITSGTITKVPLNTEYFDTNNNFDPTTNYRFTPTVAGYYQINATVRITGSAIIAGSVFLYKNGSPYLHNILPIEAATQTIGSIATVIYFNGATDYLEVYGYAVGSSLVFNAGGAPYHSSMSGFLARAA